MARQVNLWNLSSVGGQPFRLEPTTAQLTAIPFDPTAASPGRGWQRLVETPTRPPMPGEIFIPDPPTPQPALLGNDTPTPAEITPGSWKLNRRIGEHVDRPPAINLIPPSSSSGSSSPKRPHYDPEMPSPSKMAQSCSTNTSSYVTADERRRSDNSSSSESTDHEITPHPHIVAPIQSLQAAKLATHHGQLDGTTENDSQKPIRRKKSCTEYCRSLKGIPKKINGLFRKEKSSQQDGRGPTEPGSSASEPKAHGLWANSLKRFKKEKTQSRKPIPSFDGNHSPTRSKQHLLASSGAPKGTTDESSSADAEEVNRFDDPSAPQAFGAPTHEEDLPLAFEPESFLGSEPPSHDPWAVSNDAAQRQAEMVARQAGSSRS
ncbi:MAG: hypothetical protein Q9203_003496 [Teloschistes exilis]